MNRHALGPLRALLRRRCANRLQHPVLRRLTASAQNVAAQQTAMLRDALATHDTGLALEMYAKLGTDAASLTVQDRVALLLRLAETPAGPPLDTMHEIARHVATNVAVDANNDLDPALLPVEAILAFARAYERLEKPHMGAALIEQLLETRPEAVAAFPQMDALLIRRASACGTATPAALLLEWHVRMATGESETPVARPNDNLLITCLAAATEPRVPVRDSQRIIDAATTLLSSKPASQWPKPLLVSMTTALGRLQRTKALSQVLQNLLSDPRRPRIHRDVFNAFAAAFLSAGDFAAVRRLYALMEQERLVHPPASPSVATFNLMLRCLATESPPAPDVHAQAKALLVRMLDRQLVPTHETFAWFLASYARVRNASWKTLQTQFSLVERDYPDLASPRLAAAYVLALVRAGRSGSKRAARDPELLAEISRAAALVAAANDASIVLVDALATSLSYLLRHSGNGGLDALAESVLQTSARCDAPPASAISALVAWTLRHGTPKDVVQFASTLGSLAATPAEWLDDALESRHVPKRTSKSNVACANALLELALALPQWKPHSVAEALVPAAFDRLGTSPSLHTATIIVNALEKGRSAPENVRGILEKLAPVVAAAERAAANGSKDATSLRGRSLKNAERLVGNLHQRMARLSSS